MTTKDEAIQKAIDTLAELCDPFPASEDHEGAYRLEESRRERRNAAERILDHYREQDTLQTLKTLEVTINGAVPVRPMTRAEVQS